MISPAVLRALADAGATADMILAAIEADRGEQAAHIAIRRAKDAERKRAQRERDKASEMSRGQAVTDADSSGQVVTFDQRNSPLNPPKETTSSSSLRSDEGAASAPDGAMDVRKLLFSEGLQGLIRLTGKTEGRLRPMLGRWLRDTDDDALRVLGIVNKAIRDQPAEPIAWIERHFQARPNGHAPPRPKPMSLQLSELCDVPIQQIIDEYNTPKHRDATSPSDSGRNSDGAQGVVRPIRIAGR